MIPLLIHTEFVIYLGRLHVRSTLPIGRLHVLSALVFFAQASAAKLQAAGFSFDKRTVVYL